MNLLLSRRVPEFTSIASEKAKPPVGGQRGGCEAASREFNSDFRGGVGGCIGQSSHMPCLFPVPYVRFVRRPLQTTQAVGCVHDGPRVMSTHYGEWPMQDRGRDARMSFWISSTDVQSTARGSSTAHGFAVPPFVARRHPLNPGMPLKGLYDADRTLRGRTRRKTACRFAPRGVRSVSCFFFCKHQTCQCLPPPSSRMMATYSC